MGCHKFLLVVLLLLSLGVVSAKAQRSDFKFRHITTAEGLSQSNVTCVLQDSQGFMWFGTQDGLNKFDGYSFTVYRNSPHDSNSISSNYINYLLEDKDRNLWIATQGGGLNRLDRDKDSFVHYKHNPENSNSVSSNKIKTIYEDKEGILWIGTDGAGLDAYDPEKNTWSHYTNNYGVPTTIGYNIVTSIFEDSRGYFWVGTHIGGLNLLDRKTGHFSHFPVNGGDKGTCATNINQIFEDSRGNLWISVDGGGLSLYKHETATFTHYLHDDNNENSISNNTITCLGEDKQGNLWIGTRNGGLDIMDRNGNITHSRQDVNNSNSINNNSIYAIYRDPSDNMWVGTYAGGVNLYLGLAEKFAHYKQEVNNPNSLSHSDVLAIQEDREGNVWIGTDGGGLNKFNPKDKSFQHFRVKEQDPEAVQDKVIMCLTEDKKEGIWMGTLTKGLSVLEKKSGSFKHYNYNNLNKPSEFHWNAITCMITDHLGDIWIGSWGGGLSHYSVSKDTIVHYAMMGNEKVSDKKVSNNIIFTLHEDKAHNIWIGTGADGLSMWDRKSGLFTHYNPDASNPKSLSGNQVNVFHEDKSGKLWVGTNEGLNLFHPETKTFTVLRIEDGLPNNVIQGIMEDERGSFWLSTNGGIAHFNPVKKTFKNYDVSDGLQGNEFKRHSFWKSKSGVMYFGGANGINVFHPDSLKDNLYIPSVYITGFQIFNKPVLAGEGNSPLEKHISQTKEVTLSYEQSVFTLEFAALNYALPEKNQYAYKLEGFDKEWNYVGSKRSATYTNLDPGSYTFRVKGSNNDEVWNEKGTALAIIITPPYWQTWWFKTLLALSVVGGAFTFYRVRMNAIQAQKKALEEQVEERTAEVVVQKEELQAQAEVLQLINTQVMDSISCANSIQKAILPSSDKIRKVFPEHFILYRPKDIVSGDFYWFTHLSAADTAGESGSDLAFIAVIDCTGHGVPGAFMSIIGNNLLHEIINLRNILDPAQVLEELDRGVMRAVEKSEEVNTAGMDVCLLKLEKMSDGQMKVSFSGAKRPLFYVKEGSTEIVTVEADRRSIGASKLDKPFTTQELLMEKGTALYLFSDGYVDQNNPERKKLGTPKLKECIIEAVNSPMEEQLRLFESVLDTHQQGAEQRDDITLIGLRV